MNSGGDGAQGRRLRRSAAYVFYGWRAESSDSVNAVSFWEAYPELVIPTNSTIVAVSSWIKVRNSRIVSVPSLITAPERGHRAHSSRNFQTASVLKSPGLGFITHLAVRLKSGFHRRRCFIPCWDPRKSRIAPCGVDKARHHLRSQLGKWKA